jgi:hypothetical protein
MRAACVWQIQRALLAARRQSYRTGTKGKGAH